MERLHLKIRGIVQGVGFRPCVHKLVRRCGLNGYIKNTSSGVELELEGERPALERFVTLLPDRAPALAVIESMEAEYSTVLRGYEDFTIAQSQREEFRNTLISPDIGICEDCLRELRDPRDRRYRYPFINCTNCGPRFTIIKDVPYDRAKTSMASFPMCPACDREYHDIENRRYHAQPDCCPDCGPRVFYLDELGNEIPGDGIELAREALKAGKIIAVKGLGGMHLACRCDEEVLVRSLRRRKQRDEKPFALMCRNVDCVRRICRLPEAEEKILTGFRRPIVLLEKRQPGYEYLSENGYLGVMLPYTPLHYLLFGDDIDMLVMTSANLSDTPILFKNDEALEKLRGIADGYLLHNREIQTRCDDSLCWVLDGREYFARRSRGYVPFPLRMEGELHSILACGAEQKASFCLSKGSYVFQSQHIGDLKNMETLENYSQQIAHFKNLFDIEPSLAVCDLHPDYMSTEYAQSLGLPLIQVQHHHAHLAACMADTPASAVILDGLMRGKNVVVNIDGCCPDHAERLKRGFHMAEPLKQALRNNLETLRSFGAHLTTSGGLYDKTLRAVGGPQTRTAAPAARPEAAPRKQEGSGQLRLEGRVLSGRHVQGCPPHSTLWVPRETLITQLAADEARRRDICIRKET